MTQKHRAAIIYCLIFTFLLYTRKATKYFPFVKECKSQLLHVFQNSRTNLSNIIFLYPFFKMKITQQPCSRGTLEHIQNEMKFFLDMKLASKYSYLKTFGQLQYIVALAKSTQVCYFLLVLFYFFSPWKTPEGVLLCMQV